MLVTMKMMMKILLKIREAVKNYLADFFLNGIGGYPLPPLMENHCAQKSLAERGVTPPERANFGL